MPYKKKVTKRKAPRRRNVTAKRVAKLVKQMRPEVKTKEWNHTNIAGTGFNSISYGSGTTMALLAGDLQPGVGSDQRIGRSIRVIGLRFHLAFQNPYGTGGDLFNNVRLLLVRPKSERNSVGGTLISSILSGAPSGPTQWCGVVDTTRYQVYFDKMMNLTSKASGYTGESAAAPATRFFKKFVKLRARINWDESDNCLRDLIFVAISDSAAVPNPGTIAGVVRMYYTDN